MYEYTYKNIYIYINTYYIYIYYIYIGLIKRCNERRLPLGSRCYTLHSITRFWFGSLHTVSSDCPESIHSLVVFSPQKYT